MGWKKQDSLGDRAPGAQTIGFTAKKPNEEPEILQEALGTLTGLKDLKKQKQKQKKTDRPPLGGVKGSTLEKQVGEPEATDWH